MVDESAAQSGQDRNTPAQPEVPDSDSELLEDALQQALDAHAAGLLAAPFGVDETALRRARRRAIRADIRRRLAEYKRDAGSA